MRKEFKKLDSAVKSFIENRVRELGSLEAVKLFYPTQGKRNCMVNRYAVWFAKKELRGGVN